MTSKNQNNKSNPEFKNSKSLKLVSPLAERLGVFLIAIITIMGAALIVYTGFHATLYSPEERPELLTREDVDLDLDLASDEGDQEEPQENDGESNSTDDQDENEDNDYDTNLSTSFTGVITDDGVNVRVNPEANELTSILVQLHTGDEIEVINSDYNEDWVQVRYNGDTGYIAKGLVEPAE